MVDIGVAGADDPFPLGPVDNASLAGCEVSSVAGVDHDEADATEISGKAEAIAVSTGGELFGAASPIAQDLLTVVDGQQRVQQPFVTNVGRTEVAEVLVQPIRHESADDVFHPPFLAMNVFHPSCGDVPIVDHVVVVEDHRRRYYG